MTGFETPVALHALQRLRREPSSGTLVTADGEPFDVNRYSVLKYGGRSELAAQGAALGEAILALHPVLRSDAAAPLFPVAYVAVPPACYYLAEAAARVISAARSEYDAALPPAQIVRIAKSDVVVLDYATATAEERAASLRSLTFTIEAEVGGHAVVLVDDARITGGAERTAINAVLDAGRPSLLVGACLIEADADLQQEPAVEAELNHAAITSALDMLPWIQRGDFVLTIRWLKNLLALLQAEPSAWAVVTERFPAALLCEIVTGARASGAGVTNAYAAVIDQLAATLEAP